MNNQETYKMTDEELLERMRKYSETMNVLSAGSTKKRQGYEQQTGNYEGLTDRQNRKLPSYDNKSEYHKAGSSLTTDREKRGR